MRFHGLDLNLLGVLDVLLAEQNITRAGERLRDTTELCHFDLTIGDGSAYDSATTPLFSRRH